MSFGKNGTIEQAKFLSAACSLFLITACAATPASAPPTVTRAADPHEEVFQTPQEAVEALITANRNDQPAEIVKILGPRAKKLVYSGDKVADQHAREKFLAAYDEAHELVRQNPDRDVLQVGENEWPMPIPLDMVKGGGWQWNTAAGSDEIINRRIGRNELNAIGVARAYVEAQDEYGDLHPVGKNGHHEYAQKLLSDKGTRDGLYWPVKDGETESPLGPLVARARAEGYVDKEGHPQHEPYRGYFFKILKSQGEHARGGEKDYIGKKGLMTHGYAMIAFPAKYGNSGIMTFVVNHNGIVYERNLGKDTDTVAPAIEAYDPDKNWKPVE
jgi:hypothetical protein